MDFILERGKTKNDKNKILIDKGDKNEETEQYTIQKINSIIYDKQIAEKDWYKEHYQNCNCNLGCCSFDCSFNCCLCCLKDKYKKSAIKEIKDIEDVQKSIDKYDKNIQKINDNDQKFCNLICNDVFIFLFFCFHYFGIAQINSLLYSLFGEMKRCIFIYMRGIYEDKLTTGSFQDFLENSNIKDSSQINYFYITSFITPYLLKCLNIYVLYIICFLSNIIIILCVWLYDYLPPQETIKYANYGLMEFIAKVVLIYCFFYLFTGILVYIPFEIIQRKMDYISSYRINIPLILAIIVKIIVFEKINLSDNYILRFLYFYLIGHAPIFIFIIGRYILNYIKKECKNEKKSNIIENQNKNNDDDEQPLVEYSLGKLNMSYKNIEISIKTKETINVFYYFCDRRLLFLLFVNLCSRVSKLKFKTIYKDNYDENICFIILNFTFSFLIFVFMNLIYYYFTKEKENENEKEKIRDICFCSFMLIENGLNLFFSLLSLVKKLYIYAFL